MLLSQPLWLGSVETFTFIVLIAVFAYNRMVNWRKYNERTTALETAFKQYQEDMKQYLSLCELCRAEVRVHHEDANKHVTSDLREQISHMARALDEIKSFLMTNPR